MCICGFGRHGTVNNAELGIMNRPVTLLGPFLAISCFSGSPARRHDCPRKRRGSHPLRFEEDSEIDADAAIEGNITVPTIARYQAKQIRNQLLPHFRRSSPDVNFHVLENPERTTFPMAFPLSTRLCARFTFATLIKPRSVFAVERRRPASIKSATWLRSFPCSFMLAN